MPDGDDEVGAGETHHLAGLHHLAGGGQFGVVDVVDGLEDGEEGVVVALQLRPLVRVHRVLHGQRVQSEGRGDPRELGLRRLVQADPGETAVLADPADRLTGRQTRRTQHPPPAAVHGAVDHRAARRRVAGGVVAGLDGGGPAQGRTYGRTQVGQHRHGRLLLAHGCGPYGWETLHRGRAGPGRGGNRTGGQRSAVALLLIGGSGDRADQRGRETPVTEVEERLVLHDRLRSTAAPPPPAGPP